MTKEQILNGQTEKDIKNASDYSFSYADVMKTLKSMKTYDLKCIFLYTFGVNLTKTKKTDLIELFNEKLGLIYSKNDLNLSNQINYKIIKFTWDR